MSDKRPAIEMTNRVAHLANRPLSARVLRAGLAFAALVVVGLRALPDDVRCVPQPLTAVENPNVAEGAAWWQGRLDLPRRVGEIVTVDGRHYNIYPPLASIVAAAFHPFTPGLVPAWWSAVMLGVLLPMLALGTFTRATRSLFWGSVLTAVYLLGSPLLPVAIHVFRSGSVYHVNQAYSQIGLMLLLFELLGRRRGWVMVAGLIAGAWARQLVVLHAPLVLLAAWYAPSEAPSAHRARRVASLGVAAAGVIVAVGGLLLVNASKFGNPLETGYRHLDGLRGDEFAPQVAAGASGPFALRYVPRNLYFMHLSPPGAAWAHGRLIFDGNSFGTSIWLTVPLLLYVFVDLRRIIHDRQRLALLLAALAVMVVQLAYFNTGYAQRGYSRFALDFLPALLVLIGPSVAAGARRYVTPVLVAWSLLYFGWLTHQ